MQHGTPLSLILSQQGSGPRHDLSRKACPSETQTIGITMAGFGFSIGDFFAVGQFAWTVYKSCAAPRYPSYAALTDAPGKGAGGAFEEVSHEGIPSIPFQVIACTY